MRRIERASRRVEHRGGAIEAAASPRRRAGCSAADVIARPRCRERRARGHSGSGSRAELDITDARGGRGRDRRAAPGRGRQLRGLDRRRRRRGRRARRDAGQRHRRRDRRGDRRRPRRAASSTSPATTSSTAPRARPYVESDLPAAISAYGRSKQAGETSTQIANPRHFIVRSSWLFGTDGPNFVETMLRVGAEQPRGDRRLRPGREPHLHRRIWPQALALLIETEEYGIHHIAAAGRCSWFEFAQEIFDQAGVDCRVMAGTTEMLGRPAPRPPLSLLVTERPDPISLPDWHQGLARVPGGARGEGACDERPGHRRRRLHRLRLRPPPPRDPSRLLGSGARQAHLRGPAWRTSRASTSPGRAGRRRHRRRRRGHARARGLRRDRQLRGRDPRRPLDRGAGRVHPDRRLRHLRAARGGARRRASGTCRSRPTRSTARSTRARSPRSSPIDPSSPYSASKAGGDLMVGAYRNTYGTEALIVRASNNYGPRQYPEKLIPLCILNALAGDHAAGLRRRDAGPQLALGDPTSRRRSTPCSSSASRARSTTWAAPTSSRTSRS